jgi:hypothetical protein
MALTDEESRGLAVSLDRVTLSLRLSNFIHIDRHSRGSQLAKQWSKHAPAELQLSSLWAAHLEFHPEFPAQRKWSLEFFPSHLAILHL